MFMWVFYLIRFGLSSGANDWVVHHTHAIALKRDHVAGLQEDRRIAPETDPGG